jgi:hypothetical protein
VRPCEGSDLQVVQRIQTSGVFVSWRASGDGHLTEEITKRESQSDDWLMVGLHLWVGLPKGILLVLGMTNASSEVLN